MQRKRSLEQRKIDIVLPIAHLASQSLLHWFAYIPIQDSCELEVLTRYQEAWGNSGVKNLLGLFVLLGNVTRRTTIWDDIRNHKLRETRATETLMRKIFSVDLPEIQALLRHNANSLIELILAISWLEQSVVTSRKQRQNSTFHCSNQKRHVPARTKQDFAFLAEKISRNQTLTKSAGTSNCDSIEKSVEFS